MVVTFSEFSFDTEACRLYRGDRPVPLQHQPGLVLRYLIEHPDRIVTRDELVRHVWPDTHVNFNQSLNYCIRQIRLALREDAAAAKFLATRPREGYRWIAPRQTAAITPAKDRLAHGLALNGRLSRPVPAWGALALTALFSILTAASLVTSRSWWDRPPADVAIELGQPSNHLRLAIAALHTLSHALVEPTRRPEGPRAVQTLWVVTASHFGLTSDSDLR